MKYILIRGGGDLASGVALRLYRAGFKPVICELPAPMAVRRTVSFSEAIYDGTVTIEGISASHVGTVSEAFQLLEAGIIPVLVDPQAGILATGKFFAMVDARLLKKRTEFGLSPSPLVIGLGPGFICGENCHAVVETQRGHFLGRVYWKGSASEDTGQPEGDPRRVFRAPVDGVMTAFCGIGEHVQQNQLIAEIEGVKITAPFGGVLRGLIRPGVWVRQGVKIGDIDPRDDASYCCTVSDKARAIGGGVLDAILFGMHSRPSDG